MHIHIYIYIYTETKYIYIYICIYIYIYIYIEREREGYRYIMPLKDTHRGPPKTQWPIAAPSRHSPASPLNPHIWSLSLFQENPSGTLQKLRMGSYLARTWVTPLAYQRVCACEKHIRKHTRTYRRAAHMKHTGQHQNSREAAIVVAPVCRACC